MIADMERQNKRDNISTEEDNLPKLWILSPTVSTTIMNYPTARRMGFLSSPSFLSDLLSF